MTTRVFLRLVTDEDREGVRTLLQLAFGGEDEVELVDALVGGPAHIPDLELLAEDGDDIVGYILFTRASVEEALPGMISRSVPAIALAPLAVHPERQGQGIGAELVREGLGRARTLGEGIALVLGHPEYYPRFGFHEALRYGIAPPKEVPSEAWMVAELVPGALTGVRGKAVLAAAFDNPKYW